MLPQRDAPPKITISDVVDAVVLFDHPILDHRFTEFVARHPHAEARRRLLGVPAVVTRGARITRAAAFEWERVADPVLMDDAVVTAERMLLQTLLESAEAQIRLKASIARQAPTLEVRDLLEAAIGLHREITHDLRHAVGTLNPPAAEGPHAGARETARYAQVEDEAGDLRGQVEQAIRIMRDEGKEPRALTVSHVALRHLRDAGCFRDGDTTIMRVPVNVDLAWEAAEFALHSYETVSLEEVVRGTKS